MSEPCPNCGHSIAVHFENEDGDYECSVAGCDCLDTEPE